jgi:Tfp pilus assembly protein PilV
MKAGAMNRRGFSLVEVTLALGVASICLIAIFGLLPVGLQTNQDAIQQIASADILGHIIADLKATPVTTPRGGSTASPQFAINIPANPVSAPTISTLFFSAEGEFSTSANLESRYRLTITFLPNTGSRSATLAHLKMTWPAAASPVHAASSAEMFLALERN